MKAASISDIKKELAHTGGKQLQELCLRLAKYKAENKELLTYLLFEAHDEAAYTAHIKEELDDLFETVNRTNVYLAKKTLRKILRSVNKHAKYSGIPQTDLELRIYFCQGFIKTGIKLGQSQVLANMYQQQLAKIDKALEKLPEDLRYDFHDSLTIIMTYGGRKIVL